MHTKTIKIATDRDTTINRPDLGVLLKPGFIIALVILLINDHYLKYSYPSYLTGKLSDFSGLYVFAIFLFAIFSSLIKSHRSLILLNLSVAIIFIAWKLLPVEVPLAWLVTNLNFPVFSRTKDISDLLAIAILPPSYRVMAKRLGQTVTSVKSLRNSAPKALVAGLAFFAIVATSYLRTTIIKDEVSVNKWIFESELELLVFKVMESESVKIDTLYWTKDNNLIFEWQVNLDTIPPTEYNSSKSGRTKIEMLNSEQKLKFEISLITLNTPADSLHRHIATNRVIEPLKQALKVFGK